MAKETVTATPNRTKVLNLIAKAAEKGEGFTREQLCEALDISKASLASVFTQLRLMGKFPLTNADKTIRIGTEEEYQEYMENRGTSSTVEVSPEKKRKSLQTTISRATTTMEKLFEDKDDDEESGLRYNLAAAKKALAEWELAQLPEEPETDADAPAE